MRKFDLKAALSGEKVRYRDMATCEFLKLSKWEGKPCIQFARIGERSEHLSTDLDGKVLFCTDNGDTQLTMAPRKVKKTVWVNFNRDRDGVLTATPYDAHDVAKITPPSTRETRIATAVPVEIEVEE